MSNSGQPVSVTERRIEYRCRFMEIYRSRADFGTFSKDYYVVDFKQRGGVVAVNDGKILLVRQYRFLPNDDSWELPGGTVDDHETAAAGLERECLEETGVRVKDLKSLLVYYPGLDNVDNRTSVFYTQNTVVEREFSPNRAEITDIAWIPVERCVAMVFRQEILDAMTVAGILGYALLLKQGS